MQYTKEELNRILEDHKLWLKDEGGKRADLSYANLRGAYLRGADLRGANLIGAYLMGANLSYADLRGADLRDADLRGANLSNANLSNADLRGANLIGAYLIGANLSYADLRGANLRDADLRGANLSNADLRGANLSNADLYGSIFDELEKIRKGIILEEPMIGYKKCDTHIVTLVILEESMIGYKKCDTHIVTLEIPVGAIVYSINNGKCRTNKAKVLAVSDGLDEVASNWDDNFIYRIGEEKTIKDFDMMYNIECSTGIHFFRTKEEAENYQD